MYCKLFKSIALVAPLLATLLGEAEAVSSISLGHCTDDQNHLSRQVGDLWRPLMGPDAASEGQKQADQEGERAGALQLLLQQHGVQDQAVRLPALQGLRCVAVPGCDQGRLHQQPHRTAVLHLFS